MCGRLPAGKGFLHVQSWSVQPCVRPHMRVSLSMVLDAERVVQGGTLVSQALLQTSHPAGWYPNHCPAFGTRELQEGGTTL